MLKMQELRRNVVSAAETTKYDDDFELSDTEKALKEDYVNSGLKSMREIYLRFYLLNLSYQLVFYDL